MKIQSLRAFVTKINNDWIFNMSAALAYNVILSLFPILLAILALIGIVFGNLAHHEQEVILSAIATILPKEIPAHDIANTLFHQLARASGNLEILAIIIALFAGSRLFILIENCFGFIYHFEQRGVMKQNLVAFIMLISFIVLIPVIIFLTSILPIAVSYIEQISGVQINHPVSYALGILISMIVSFLFFLALYRVIPNMKNSFRSSYMGAFISSLLLEMYLLLFPVYANHFLGGYTGRVGLLIIVLLFFYYFSVIILLGAEVNAYFALHLLPSEFPLPSLLFHVHKDEDRHHHELRSSEKPFSVRLIVRLNAFIKKIRNIR